jgi:hypothetical protein
MHHCRNLKKRDLRRSKPQAQSVRTPQQQLHAIHRRAGCCLQVYLSYDAARRVLRSSREIDDVVKGLGSKLNRHIGSKRG